MGRGEIISDPPGVYDSFHRILAKVCKSIFFKQAKKSPQKILIDKRNLFLIFIYNFPC